MFAVANAPSELNLSQFAIIPDLSEQWYEKKYVKDTIFNLVRIRN